MRFEIIQFIVPLAFLAIWALTALLNRTAEALPPRPTGGGADGLMRGTSAAARTGAAGPGRYLGAAERLADSADLRPGSRWSNSGLDDRASAERRAMTDERVMILDNASRATASVSGYSANAPRATRPQANKRTVRKSNAVSAAPRPAEPSKPRALSGLVNRPLSDGKARPLEIAPLATPLVPMNLTLAQSISSSVTAAAPRSEPAPAVTHSEIRSRLAAANQLREIAILSEILQPPVSVRRQRGAR
jgi:hypothetical protein